jgi:hypothetical protein
MVSEEDLLPRLCPPMCGRSLTFRVAIVFGGYAPTFTTEGHSPSDHLGECTEGRSLPLIRRQSRKLLRSQLLQHIHGIRVLRVQFE